MLLRPCVRRVCHRLPRPALRSNTRSYSSLSGGDDKPYYVTTPIFYPNSGTDTRPLECSSFLTPTAVPHIGHLYTLVTTDILARHARLSRPDRTVNFLTGTDEHGLKIQKAAEAQNSKPLEFCDRISDRFRVCSFTRRWIYAILTALFLKVLAGKADASYTRFIRTSEEDHHYAVQHVWVGDSATIPFKFSHGAVARTRLERVDLQRFSQRMVLHLRRVFLHGQPSRTAWEPGKFHKAFQRGYRCVQGDWLRG